MFTLVWAQLMTCEWYVIGGTLQDRLEALAVKILYEQDAIKESFTVW